MRVNDFYGNKFKWFTGVVKEAEGGKVRVRCFGIHPFEVDGMGDGPAYVAVSNGDLPYATVVYPVNATAPEHLLQLEDWVYGFFADGDSCQQPVVVGKLGRSDGSAGSSFLGGGSGSGGPPGDDYTGPPGGDYTGPIGTLGNAYKSSGTGPNANINVEKYYGYIPGSSNAQKAFNLYTTFLTQEEGIDLPRAKQIAAGIVGSLMGESGKNLDPSAIGDGGYAHGIAQWNDRRIYLFQMCQKGDLECQLNYSISELKNRNFGHGHEGKESPAWNKVKGASNFAEASDLWTRYYERPSLPKYETRKSFAAGAYRDLAGNYEPARIGIASAGSTAPAGER